MLNRKLKFCKHTKIRSKQEINKNTNHKKRFVLNGADTCRRLH